MSDPLQKAVQMLDRELENNSKLTTKNGILLREVRQLRAELEKRVIIHPDLFMINEGLINTDETIIRVLDENAKLIKQKSINEQVGFFEKLRRLF